MNEKEIMELITSEYSWEQILYKIVAWEGLDPWDLDIRALSESFLEYLKGIKMLDFKVPAKYIMIAAILLRMKSDHLKFLEIFTDPDIVDGSEIIEPHAGENGFINGGQMKLDLNPINVPQKRQPTRRVTINELISALRKAVSTHEKKRQRTLRARGKIEIKDSGLNQRIDELYNKIHNILAKIKTKETTFSDIVEKWDRKNIVETFIPVIFLDHEKKINCRQDEMFKEIYIKKPDVNK